LTTDQIGLAASKPVGPWVNHIIQSNTGVNDRLSLRKNSAPKYESGLSDDAECS